jgi:hypothetical protein
MGAAVSRRGSVAVENGHLGKKAFVKFEKNSTVVNGVDDRTFVGQHHHCRAWTLREPDSQEGASFASSPGNSTRKLDFGMEGRGGEGTIRMSLRIQQTLDNAFRPGAP